MGKPEALEAGPLAIILFLAQSHQTAVDMEVALAQVLVPVAQEDQVVVLTILLVEALAIPHQHHPLREVMEVQG
jgi:hypothetical protein